MAALRGSSPLPGSTQSPLPSKRGPNATASPSSRQITMAVGKGEILGIQSSLVPLGLFSCDLDFLTAMGNLKMAPFRCGPMT
eukprot:766044-Hanusia_phi.AAC.4